MSGFKDVVGHKDIIQYIQNAVEQDKVSHAYILNGAKGSGKKMLAKLFAMTLQCENSQSEPCGECLINFCGVPPLLLLLLCCFPLV